MALSRVDSSVRARTPNEGEHRIVAAETFRQVLGQRVLVAEGAMGTMLQAYDLSVDGDFQGLEGCNEILNVSRPDVVRAIHDAYYSVGVDCVETNTFGSNLSALTEYDIPERIYELA